MTEHKIFLIRVRGYDIYIYIYLARLEKCQAEFSQLSRFTFSASEQFWKQTGQLFTGFRSDGALRENLKKTGWGGGLANNW